VVGPEVPLSEGITDELSTDSRLVFGPLKEEYARRSPIFLAWCCKRCDTTVAAIGCVQSA